MKLAVRMRGARDGFTLIEILFALMLFMIGMTGILAMLTFGATMTRSAALRGRSAAAAEAVFADLSERLFPIVVEQGVETLGDPIAIENRELTGYPGLSYSAHAVADPAQVKEYGHALEYRVDVEITYTSGGLQKTRTFTTLLPREVGFGERLRREFIEHAQPVAAAAAPAH